jgi:hypothetical protein
MQKNLPECYIQAGLLLFSDHAAPEESLRGNRPKTGIGRTIVHVGNTVEVRHLFFSFVPQMESYGQNKHEIQSRASGGF